MRNKDNMILEIKNRIETAIYDSFVWKYVNEPILDETKLLILITIMEEAGIEPKMIVDYAVSTMLIQIALDTHENVTNSSKDEDEWTLRTRQLTVLAGDYYSGLYYQLLAKLENISFIKLLAEGTKEVNEQKTNLYHPVHGKPAELISNLEAMEAALIINVSDYFGFNDWNEPISKMLLINRIIWEQDHFSKKGHSLLIDALVMQEWPNYSENNELSEEQTTYALSLCDNSIEEAVRELRESINERNTTQKMAERMMELFKSISSHVNTIVEEG